MTNLPANRELVDKLPPQSIEAEQSLLGCLMIDPVSIYKVVDFLLVKDFYKSQHCFLSSIFGICF